MALLATPAAAQDVRLLYPVTAEGAAALMRDAGLADADTLRDAPEGPAYVRSTAEGVQFFLDLAPCPEPDACSLIWSLRLNFQDRPAPSAEALNAWNRARFARAFINADGATQLELFVPATGGITNVSFAESLDVWMSELAAFLDHVGWTPHETAEAGAE
jgi:hypothetical protein